MTPIRQLLCEYLCEKQQEPERPFTHLRLRSSLIVWKRLRRQFPIETIKIRDGNLTAPTKIEFEAWLEKDLGNFKKYHKDWYDCDDYAMELRYKMFKFGHEYQTTFTVAYCEGWLGDEYHAYNLVTDNTDEIYIIEPQNDHLVLASESKYRTEFIQI